MKSAKTTLKSAAVLAAVLILVAGCGRKNDLQLTTRTPNLEVRQADAAAKAAEEGGEEARKRKEPKDTPFILDPLIK